MATFDAALNKILTWYKRAVQMGKNQQYLDRIPAVGENYKVGQPLSEKAMTSGRLQTVATMHQDMEWQRSQWKLQ